jgi:hypothetical protein
VVSLPWIVAAIAMLAFLALIVGQRFGSSQPQTLSSVQPDPSAGVGMPAGTRAPDISNMSPAERAMRLYNRVMEYDEAGKMDSVQMFAPMAIAAYEMLGDLDLDGHFDVGRIAEISGNASVAKAQADTILQKNPNHLLGLILAAHAAKMENRPADERKYYQRLVAAEPTERPKQLAEYIAHEHDIITGMDEARRVVRR